MPRHRPRRFDPHQLVRVVQGACEYMHFAERDALDEAALQKVAASYLRKCRDWPATSPEDGVRREYQPPDWSEKDGAPRRVDLMARRKGLITLACEMKLLVGTVKAEYTHEEIGKQSATGKCDEIVEAVVRVLSLRKGFGRRGVQRLILVAGTARSFQQVWGARDGLLQQVLRLDDSRRRKVVWDDVIPRLGEEGKRCLHQYFLLRPDSFVTELVARDREMAEDGEEEFLFEARAWRVR